MPNSNSEKLYKIPFGIVRSDLNLNLIPHTGAESLFADFCFSNKIALDTLLNGGHDSVEFRQKLFNDLYAIASRFEEQEQPSEHCLEDFEDWKLKFEAFQEEIGVKSVQKPLVSSPLVPVRDDTGAKMQKIELVSDTKKQIKVKTEQKSLESLPIEPIADASEMLQKTELDKDTNRLLGKIEDLKNKLPEDSTQQIAAVDLMKDLLDPENGNIDNGLLADIIANLEEICEYKGKILLEDQPLSHIFFDAEQALQKEQASEGDVEAL